MAQTFEQAMAEAYERQRREEAAQKDRQHKEFLARVAEVDNSMKRYLPRYRCKPIG